MPYSGAKNFTGMGQQSVLSTSNLFQGFWSAVDVKKGGFDPAGTAYDATAPIMYLGVVPEGALEISREDTEFLGTNFPQTVELLTPSQVGMKFSGEIAEMHKLNLHLSIGDDPYEDNGGSPANASNFIYPAASCESSSFVSVRALRKRCDGFIMDMVIWKARNAAPLTIAGGTEVLSTPIEFNALDDNNAEYGGSSEAPLGYLYAPDPVGTQPGAATQPTV